MSQGQLAAPSSSPLTRVAEWLRPRRRLVPVTRLAGPAGPAEAAVRAMAQAVPMAGETLLCRTLGRHKMLVDAGDFTHAPHLATDGFWEWWTTRFLIERLKPGQVFVDGGACYGYFNLLAAELVGPAGKVLPSSRIRARRRCCNGTWRSTAWRGARRWRSWRWPGPIRGG